MNIFVYSTHKEVKKYLACELSQTKYFTSFFSSIDKLQSAIANETSIILIFHLGLRQSDENEFKQIQSVFKHKLNTLVLTNTPNPKQGVRLLNLNVRGYANSYLDHNKLISALSVIQQGDIWSGAALIEYMLKVSSLINDDVEHLPENVSIIYKLLTSREQQIAQKILLGMQNKNIADHLSITERTVKAHLSAIYKKLKVRNRLELTLKLQQTDRRTSILNIL